MNRNEIPSYWWDLYSVCVDCYCKRRIKNYWNALATALPLLTGNYTPRYFIGCVTCWLFSLICGWWVSIQHIIVIIWRWKFFLQPSVLIPIDCPVAGPEPSMLNLLALSKKNAEWPKEFDWALYYFERLSLNLIVSLVRVLQQESLILFDYRT